MNDLIEKNKKNPTPMIAQYLSIKSEFQDCLLFYRMGDFYELFFEDAIKASEALEIHLTKRGQLEGKSIPMCGVPVHTSDNYLSKLIRKGFKVAVCEQINETTKKQNKISSTLVHREVVRIVTPGTITEDSLLESKRNSFLTSVVLKNNNIALASIDLSTGDFWTTETCISKLMNDLSRIDPREILIDSGLSEKSWFKKIKDEYEITFTQIKNENINQAIYKICEAFKVESIESFGSFSESEILAVGVIINYIDVTQKGKVPNLKPPKTKKTLNWMEIDSATQKNLELFKSVSGYEKGSLLNSIDKTKTSSGGRLLRSLLSSPFVEPEKINSKLDAVQFFIERSSLQGDIRDFLSMCPDIERAVSRLSLGRGGPRDLSAVKEAAERAASIRTLLKSEKTPKELNSKLEDLFNNYEVMQILNNSIVSDPPTLVRDGNFIKKAFNSELDKLRSFRDESRKHISKLQKEYSELTKIPSLKIRYNNILGYFVEVTTKNTKKLTEGLSSEIDSIFIHRQTMANAMRFTTVTLGNLEGEIASATDRSLKLEIELFEQIRTCVLNNAQSLLQTSLALAEIDVIVGFSILAKEKNYTRPLIDRTNTFKIVDGRHPVVENKLSVSGESSFISNSSDLSEEKKLWLVTGPNMAGKSTFLRQNGLIAILAQMGSFVPAAEAHIGTIDKIFSRVGAADDLAKGRSTFMVEMLETASILHQATKKSFVILDEIGRGTATYDGLSIAWATIEYLHEVSCCRSLFATHFHELAALKDKYEKIHTATMQIKEWNDEIVFLHKVADGSADKSYGISVAKLAGLPESLILRAVEVLKNLEKENSSSNKKKLLEDLPLFSAELKQSSHTYKPVVNTIKELNPENLTPKNALDIIYKLKEMVEKIKK